MHAQYVPAGPIEPGHEHDLIAWRETQQPVDDVRFEDQPGRRPSFVGLPWGQREIAQGRLDFSDGPQVKAGHKRPPVAPKRRPEHVSHRSP
jgi:hypothetical protein